MYNINYSKLNKHLIMGFIFLTIGFLFITLYMHYVFNGAIKKLSLDEKTFAFDIDSNCFYDKNNGYMCSPVYKFRVKDKTYYCEVDNASKFIPNKKKNIVYYNSKNPNECVSEYEASVSIYSYIILFFPLFSLFLGLLIIIKKIKEIRKLKRLEKNGKLIKNILYKVEEIEIKENKIIKVISIVIKDENGKMIHLISDLPNKNIKKYGYIDLLIDKNDINNYYIDFNLEKK